MRKKIKSRENQDAWHPNLFLVTFAFIALFFLLQKNISFPKLIPLPFSTAVAFEDLEYNSIKTVSKPVEFEKDKSASTSATPTGFCINVPVLMYHHIEPLDLAKTEGHAQLTVDPTTFELHMADLISKGYRIISAEELVSNLISKTNPGKAAVVTLDDGYSDAYNYAYPVSKRYNIPLSLFIPTGLMENYGYLTWAQISEMTASNLIFAYNHSLSHFSLPSGDISKIDLEISEASKALEEHLGKKQTIFAYPYGSFDDRSIIELKKNGIQAAFSTIISTLQCDSYMYSLRRTRIGNAPLSYFGL